MRLLALFSFLVFFMCEKSWATSYRWNDPGLEQAWQYFSGLPSDIRRPEQIHPWDAQHGSGMHVDRAWEFHQGDPSTVIAILDSGIRWDDAELTENLWLNRLELPYPQGHMEYDVNHDGRVNVLDYIHDPSVSDVNKNGVIDPQDLIQIFSNQIDEDGNGFVDDIAGWDFMENDNDAGDRTNFGHGTGEARGSVGVINNGMGAAGVCPRCMALMVRIGDSFVVHADRFAAGVQYASRLPIKVIQQATGAINNNSNVIQAIEQATQRGVSIVGTAADENSFHSNFASVVDPVIYVNALRHDKADYRDATSFSQFNNCSNYGARVDVSAAALSCSSEATALVAGIVGLTYSFARLHDVKINPLQMLSLLKNNADDVDKSSMTYPNQGERTDERFTLGWDMMSGHGRVNARRMLEAVVARKIPPSLRIVNPSWFALLKRGASSELNVDLDIREIGSESAFLKIFVQRGIDSYSADHQLNPQTLVLQKYILPSTEKVSVEIPTDRLWSMGRISQQEPLYNNAWTMTVEVTTADHRVASSRRTFFGIDPESEKLLEGYPKKMPGSGEGNVMMLDIDGREGDEIIVADGQGWLHAYAMGGQEAEGYPVWMGGGVFAPLAAGDVDGDGEKEIVALSISGELMVFHASGKLMRGFPVKISKLSFDQMRAEEKLDEGALAAPIVADIDGDGYAEIIAVTLDSKLVVVRNDGSSAPGFPVEIFAGQNRARLLSSPAVVDINSDGVLDFVFGSNHVQQSAGTVFAIDGKGNTSARVHMAGFPVRIPLLHDSILPTVGTGIPTSPVIMDFDGDGLSEIVVHGFVGKTYVVSLKGRIMNSLSMEIPNKQIPREKFMLSAFGHPGVARFFPDIASLIGIGVGQRMLTSVLLGGEKFDFSHLVSAWNRDGSMVKSWPREISGMALGVGAVSADVDSDGSDEVFVGTSTMTLHGFNAQGPLKNFPKFTGGWMMGAPSVGDHDGDGIADIAASTREGYVFVWRAGEKTGFSSVWPTFKGNNARTGNVFLPKERGLE